MQLRRDGFLPLTVLQGGQPKIAQLGISRKVDKDIFRLQVSVYDTETVYMS